MIKTFAVRISLSIICFAGCWAVANADVLAQYGFNNNFNVGGSSSGLTAGTISATGTANSTYSASVFNEGSHSFLVTSLDMPRSTVVTSGTSAYTYVPYNGSGSLPQVGPSLEFTIAANAGSTINFDSISLDAFRTSTQAASRVHVALYYDDLSDGAGFVHLGSYANVATTTTWTNDNPFDLNAIGTLNSIGTAGVAFRLYFTRGHTTSSEADGSITAANGVRIDDLQIIGTVSSVPEPASYASLLLGVGVLGLFARGRIRRGLRV